MRYLKLVPIVIKTAQRFASFRMVLGLQNRYWFSKNLARHKDRLHLMKGIVDSAAPKLPTIDKKRAKVLHPIGDAILLS